MERHFVFLVLAFVCSASGQACVGPTASSLTYTTRSILLSSQTAYVAQFTVACKSGPGNMNLYAEVNDQIVPVAKVPDQDVYQVSWAAEHKKAKTGDLPIKVFDDEGYTAYRKAQRSGDDLSKVSPLFTVQLYHPGTIREGLYVQTEFIAVVCALLVWWAANTIRSQIME